MPSFNDFSLQPATRAVLATMNITEPSPIQAEAIPALLAGNDVVGQSPTGSGKTLAYSIPIVERLSKDTRSVQALILVPTRELAVQVSAVLGKFAASRRLSTALLVGGRPYGNQLSALRYGAQIVVGTPGRVKDHLDRGTLVLTELRMCVLDEADQMLDSGFAPAIEEILTTTPSTRQMALFSATMPEWIATLKKKFLKNPVNIDITLAASGESTIEQIVYQVPQDQKMAALSTLLRSTEGESSLIFGRTKYGVEKLGKQLSMLGFTVGTLHGNKSQRAREDVLSAFRKGHVHTLLATNVAARGLDITGIYQVINYELPESSDLFTHRIGRTGRMGRQGKAITLLAPADIAKWRRMARGLGQAVTLQHLALDKDALVPTALATPAVVETQEYDRRSEQRPARSRQSFSETQDYERRSEQRPTRERQPFTPSEQDRSRRVPSSRRDSFPVSDTRRRTNDSVPGRIPTRTPIREPENYALTEGQYADRERDGRRDVGTRSRIGRTTDAYKTSFVVTEPQQRVSARRTRPTSPVRARRTTTSKRSASR